MSETDQEKTEQPSQRRLEKSREQGQVPRSRELANAMTLLVASGVLDFSANYLGTQVASIIRYNFSLDRAALFDPQAMTQHLFYSALLVIPAALLILGSIMLAGIIGQIIVGGWLCSGELLIPKASRLSPAQWLKKVFSITGVVELLKSVLKILLVAGCLAMLLWHNYSRLLGLSVMPLNSALATGLEILANALFYYAVTLGLIAAVDVPYQLWSHHNNLKMTRQEVKDEHKESEGRPEIKQKIRQIQREMANQRMMQRIPEADVIVVNPTHYSVALKYDQQQASAPFVVAKGVDDIAFKIREVGQHNNVQVVKAPLLTRAIYYSTKIDQQIPDDLYLAVAQVLAYVFQLNLFRKGKSKAKPNLPELEIPDDYDQTGMRDPSH